MTAVDSEKKYRKTWENRGKRRKTRENREKKHGKTWGNKGNPWKTGEYIETNGYFYIYWGHNMESYMRY